MMKSRQSLKNLVKAGLLLNLVLISNFILGCSSSTTPTYPKEEIDQAVQDISKKEYNLDVKAKLVGSTLWVYLPLEDLVEKADKPEKYWERFAIEEVKNEFKDGALEVDYLIKPVPEQEKAQEIKYSKSAVEKMGNVWKVLRRVIFSMEQTKRGGPQFFCFVIVDIKNGLEIKEIFYYLDLKKVTYDFISPTEYQHRTVQDMQILAEVIGDKTGAHLEYKDITLGEFIALQIQHRIKLKFQKPEVDKNADIDKEILKIVVYTLKIYDFKDFSAAELNNLLTNSKISLNQAAIWARSIE